MNKNLDINWLVVSVLIGLPIIIIVGVVIYCMEYGWGMKESILAIVTYYMANISVGLGFHRLWTHASYKTKKPVEFFLMLLSAGTLQGPVLAWASDHKRHHAFADTAGDPHTPVLHTNKIKGFLWSHIGWMLVGDITANNIDKATMATLGKRKMLAWQLQYYWQLATGMNTIVPMLFGWCVFGSISLQSTIAGLFFVGLGRALQQQMTFCVNSVCHILGTKQYANDSSGDIWWLCFLLLGENYHNYHHAFAKDYRNGHKWYHFDVHKWLIAGLAKCGLASDLYVTPKERIEAKMIEMQSHLRTNWQKKLENIEEIAIKLSILAKTKISVASNMADSVVNNIDNIGLHARNQFAKLEESASALAINIKSVIAHSEKLSARIVKIHVKKLKMLQKSAMHLGLNVKFYHV